ncbi:MBL fold metallo-hydrolase [SAR202 cluster bacterium AC-647-N09_OGT_505m]|nr:MBL fold metallo-hydrolase [SAR202 cluster bacterium AC-647-N09_OGT_505m]
MSTVFDWSRRHSPGSTCLLLEKGSVLFTGDAIINNVDVGGSPLAFGSDRRDSEQSLLKLPHLGFDVCCFGH